MVRCKLFGCYRVHHDLNKLQKNNVESFATSLAGLLREIDPAKLKIVVDYIEEECELLLWRKSSQGVSKLSFDSYGQITYLFTGDSGQKTIGVFEEGVDMDKLLRFYQKFPVVLAISSHLIECRHCTYFSLAETFIVVF